MVKTNQLHPHLFNHITHFLSIYVTASFPAPLPPSDTECCRGDKKRGLIATSL